MHWIRDTIRSKVNTILIYQKKKCMKKIAKYNYSISENIPEFMVMILV
jgi:hypothetical protein